MKVTLNWLRDYVALDAPASEVKDLLAMMGFPVDAVERIGNDWRLDFDVPSNRPDCLSVIGIARELAARTQAAFRIPSCRLEEADQPTDVRVEVLDRDLCPRYTARVIRGVRVGPSPAWLQGRLEAVGMRPVNNIVDITNYVLMECGQPLHAFDAKFIRGNRIVVRRARPEEKIVAIDGKEYVLTPRMLVIADAERPQAIAGVMGGKESEIREQTTDVILESALFDPVSIRTTSKTLGLSTESSFRFERQADYHTVDWASRRAAQLMAEIAGGRVLKGVVDINSVAPREISIRLKPERIRKVLGYDVPPERVREILEALGFRVGERLTVTVPHWRKDVSQEIDLVEEVARVEGYDKIPTTATVTAVNIEERKVDLVRSEVRRLMFGAGYYEALTTSFVPRELSGEFSYWSTAEAVSLRSPDGQISELLRRSLIPGLLECLRSNEAYKERVVPLFELARVYTRKAGGFEERLCLAAVDARGYRVLKGTLEQLLDELQIRASIRRAAVPSLAEGRACEVEGLGYFGIASPKLLEAMKVTSAEVACFELDFEALARAANLERRFRPVPRLAPVRRDLAFILDASVEWQRLAACVRGAAPKDLERIELFDIYRGKGIPPGKKSVAFTVIFQPAERTPTGEEIEAAVQAIVNKVTGELGGKLRGPDAV